MKPFKSSEPPRWARAFLRWYCRPSLLEDLEGDLQEYFDRHVRDKGLRRARVIYVIDVLKFMRLYTLRKPKFFNPVGSSIMISSYFKTTRRNMARNKLFSFINIFGLSVSMAVGLLVIAVVTDLDTYDDFHEHKDRIYRVATYDYRPHHQVPLHLASTPVLAGREIDSSMAGVESLTIMRRGFGGDAVVGDALIPVHGLWADQNFLKIFSFEMLEGNPATALKDPYSIVLTESAAIKFFGTAPAMGKSVWFGTVEYAVTGVLKDVPKLSHLRFEVLGSFATVELVKPDDPEEDLLSWDNVDMNYVYLLLDKQANVPAVQAGLDRICSTQNALLKDRRITLELEPLGGVTANVNQGNSLGPKIPAGMLWTLGALAVVVIACACFNYTNLSVARALRRSREVGIRKIVGAHKRQVLTQFILEALVMALLALGFSFVMFFFMREQFIQLDPYIGRLVSLELSPRLVISFVALALVTGMLAGVAPALFYSRIAVLQALKDASGIRLFRAVNMRKTLIVVQYVCSLVFITTTLVGYNQYKSFLAFDLGFKTENILNIKLPDKNGARLVEELRKLPMVADASRSLMVIGIRTYCPKTVAYQSPEHAVEGEQNIVDEHYLAVHSLELVAGRNFNWKADSSVEREILVNEQMVKHLNIARGDSHGAVGEEVIVEDRKLTIVGVLKDFHFNAVDDKIEPVVLRYDPRTYYNYANVRINTADLPAAMEAIERTWKHMDSKRPLDARFFDEEIADAYAMFSVMLRIIGFLAFLAICIASLGLLGMVIFTTETKLKEISIRKVLGASEGSLVVFLSRDFMLLLLIAAAIALPVTYLFFDRVILLGFAYHEPVRWMDMLAGLAGVLLIAGIMVGSQTVKVARTNPASTLKSE